MIIGDIADGLTRGVESTLNTVSEAFFEPVVRIGVTGLSRAGKTVFITSLVANLISRSRMRALTAQAEGRIQMAYLQPQPDDTVARFDYESHLADLTGDPARWPEGTRSVSELRLSLRVASSGLLGGLSGPRTVHLDIVDYPGEWLLDLSLLDKSYSDWAEETLARARMRGFSSEMLEAIDAANPDARFDEADAKRLSGAYTDFLMQARDAGLSDCTPGRFLLPGDLAGSPVLTFAPLPRPRVPRRGSLWREFDRRFEAYKREVVKPFFRDHFARIDRQVVLVDALGAINSGPAALEDMQQSMGDILAAFRPGRNAFLSQLFLGRRVEKVLFAATKADHIHNSQHDRLAAIMETIVKEAKSRSDYAGADTAAMAIASLRVTTEEEIEHQGRSLPMVRGFRKDTGKAAALYPGELPDDPSRLFAAGSQDRWLDGDYAIMDFAPRPIQLKPGEGPPHIRLDRALQFLVGDRL